MGVQSSICPSTVLSDYTILRLKLLMTAGSMKHAVLLGFLIHTILVSRCNTIFVYEQIFMHSLQLLYEDESVALYAHDEIFSWRTKALGR